jgi:hypothetical protein
MGKKLIKRTIDVGNQAVVPKGITINGVELDMEAQESINISNDGIEFTKKHIANFYHIEDDETEPSVSWTDDRKYRFALQAGSPGGAGGGSSKALAVSRLDVIDPHLVLMMRDVMDSSETAARLRVGSGAGGGGGGGGIVSDGLAQAGYTPTPGNEGQDGAAAQAHLGPNYQKDITVQNTVSHSINTNAGRSGGAGGTSVQEGSNYLGAAGGGGAGGNGGAVVIITTTSSVSNINVNGGSAGEGGQAHAQESTSPGQTAGNDGQSGNTGSSIVIRV